MYYVVLLMIIVNGGGQTPMQMDGPGKTWKLPDFQIPIGEHFCLGSQTIGVGLNEILLKLIKLNKEKGEGRNIPETRGKSAN